MTDAATPLDPADALQWAHRYADLGYRVLPIRPRGKHPPMASWQHAATTDHAKIDAWWKGLYRGHGIGMAMGGGVVAIDIDVADGKPGAETLVALESELGPLPATVESVTGSGGRHMLFDVAVEVRNNAATRLGPGIDVRGDGGQIVVAPTVHPNGHPYAWRDGHEPWAITLAPLPPAWLERLVDNAEPTATAPPPTVDPFQNDTDDSIAEWLNRTADWHTTLVGDGWTEHHIDAKGDTHWTRPGKDRAKGSSGVLHEPDGPLVVFSTDAALRALHRPEAAAKEGYAYSLFGYLAATRYGGDRSACARAARATRLGLAPSVTTAPVTITLDGTEEDQGDWELVSLGAIAAELLAGTRQRETPNVMEVP